MDTLYLIYGENTIRIEEKVKELTKQYLKEVDDFNRIVFDYIETPVETIIEECLTLPFLSDRKVVIVNDAFSFTSEKKRTSVDHNIDVLIDYLQDKNDDTLLIFVVNAEKLDSRKKLTKTIKKHGNVIEIESMNERELTDYIFDTASNDHVAISNEAAQELISRTDADYSRVKSELEKLTLYVEDEITLTDIDDVVSKSLEANVFTLTDLILQNRKQEAVEVFRDLLLQKEEPIKLLGLIAVQFRLYYQTKILSSEGLRQDEIAKQLQVHPYRVKLALGAVGRYSLDNLLKKMVIIRDMDYELKSTYLDSEALFEIFLKKI